MLKLDTKEFRRVLVAGALLVIGLGLVLGQHVAAQEQSKAIGDAMLQLWPEYDDPGLLVIYSGEFTGTLQYPQEVAFPVPENARAIQATSREADGQLISQAWQIEDGRLIYTLPGPGFHIEYYLDRPPSGDQRDIPYTFETPYAIQSLEIRAQNPSRATAFSLTPPQDGSLIADDGLTYSLIERTNLQPGDTIDLGIRYNKPDQGLTLPAGTAIQITPSAPTPVAGQAAPGQSFTTLLPYLLIAIGVVALAAAILYWFLRVRGSSQAQPASSGRTSRKSPTPPAANAARQGGQAFCTNCGRQFRPEDRFCAECGAPRSRQG